MQQTITELIKQGGFALLAGISIICLSKLAGTFRDVIQENTQALTSLSIVLSEMRKEFGDRLQRLETHQARGNAK